VEPEGQLTLHCQELNNVAVLMFLPELDAQSLGKVASIEASY
jgi:hypothetical protein